MFCRLIEVLAVAIFLEPRQQRRERGADLTNYPEVDRCTAPDLLCPNIDLRNAYRRSLRIELSIGEICPQHQQYVAIEHSVIADANPMSPVMPTS
jgi:hypothetical protein